MLLDAKLHPSDSAPSNPGIGTIWYDTQNDLVKIYDNTATGNVGGWNTISGDITGVGSATTNQLTVANSSGPVPSFSIVTGAVADAGTALATGDQIHDAIVDMAQFIVGADSGSNVNVNPSLGDNETINFTGGTGISTSITGSGPTDITFAVDNTIATLTGSQTLTNKTLTSPVINTGVSGTAIKDEDNMASNSASHLATQQSIKAYVDGKTYDDVSIANLKTRLAGGFGSNAVTIGDSDDVVTIGNDLVITGDLTVSGDTISANVATLNVEDKNITLNYSSGDSSSTASGSGITIQDAVNSTTDASILWDTTGNRFEFSHMIEVPFQGLVIDGGIVMALASELNILDGATVTTAELNIMDGNTSATSTTIADADRFVMNDAGTMKQVAASDVATYINTQIESREFAVVLNASESTVTKSSNTYTVTHSLNSRDVACQVYDTSSYDTVYVDISRATVNTVEVAFARSVTDGDYKILITKIG